MHVVGRSLLEEPRGRVGDACAIYCAEPPIGDQVFDAE